VPNYHYLCHNVQCRHEFETRQSIKEPSLTKCPLCDHDSILRVLHAVTTLVRPEATTMAQLADRNTKALGLYGREDKWGKEAEAKLIANKMAREQLEANLPQGASLPELPKSQSSEMWYRPGTKEPDMALAKLTVPQQKTFIETGKV
jgi:putative FmdB family regulatory protein